MRQFRLMLCIASLIFISNTAFAKKDKRDGFNFGTGISLDSSNDQTKNQGENNNSFQTKSSTQGFSPYIGYSFSGVFNLGLNFFVGEEEKKEVEQNGDGKTLNDRNSNTTSKSASIFGRFLFGKILYFEAGFGVYKESTSINNTLAISVEGERVSGTVEDYSINGSGVGYHVGAGFEIPTGAGFYFTGSYLTKVYRINDGGSLFGESDKKNAYQQKRLLTFGLAHYYQ